MRRTRIGIAAVLLGAGLGGMLEAIVLRHIAHWHEMLSGRIASGTFESLAANLAADGWAQLLFLLLVFAGAAVLFASIRAPGRTPTPRGFAGNFLLGWGGFNLAEGALNHFVLELHHVRDLPAHAPYWDWLFLLGGGLGLVLLGLALRDAPDPAPVGAERRSGYDRRSAIRV